MWRDRKKKQVTRTALSRPSVPEQIAYDLGVFAIDTGDRYKWAGPLKLDSWRKCSVRPRHEIQ
jgi:hypothetical protein